MIKWRTSSELTGSYLKKSRETKSYYQKLSQQANLYATLLIDFYYIMRDLTLNSKKETFKVSILFFILFTATNSFLTILTFIYEQA